MKEAYHFKLKRKMDEYVHFIYKLSRSLPREELYGITSQIRRSSLSVILNYIEGYARFKNKVHKNFLEISYGSLKESDYLLYFCLTEAFISKEDYEKCHAIADEIGAMLWSTMENMNINL